MSETKLTPEQVLRTITAARDSVWVINDSLRKLSEGATLTNELRGNIERNVGHLKLVVANPEISTSGNDISDLHAAVTAGEAALV